MYAPTAIDSVHDTSVSGMDAQSATGGLEGRFLGRPHGGRKVLAPYTRLADEASLRIVGYPGGECRVEACLRLEVCSDGSGGDYRQAGTA
jgi:hypothetical protein